MRSKPMTQVGQRLIRKVWKWAKLLEVGVRLRKIMESRGMNHDSSCQISSPAHPKHSAPSVVTLTMEQPDACITELHSLLYILATPYIAPTWKQALNAADILDHFLNLVHVVKELLLM